MAANLGCTFGTLRTFVALALLASGCEGVAYAQTTPPANTTTACTRDADCGWDDSCTPRACVAAHPAPTGRQCGRPSVPGECRCITGACTLFRNEMRREQDPPLACTGEARCAFDPSHGACVTELADALRAPHERGIDCECTSSHRCQQVWRGEVSCRSWRDCAIGADGQPAPSWFTRRDFDRRVRPCRDSSRDAVCTHGVCRVVRWRC